MQTVTIQSLVETLQISGEQQHYPFSDATSSPSVPAAISLSAAPMGHTSDSSAVLMVLLHTVYIYSQLALPLLGTWMSCVLCGYQDWGWGRREGGKAPIGWPCRCSPGSYRLMGRQGFGEGDGGGQRRMAPDKLTRQPVNTGQPSRKVRAGMDKGPLDFQSFTLLGASALAVWREKCLQLIGRFFCQVGRANRLFFTHQKVFDSCKKDLHPMQHTNRFMLTVKKWQQFPQWLCL